MNTKNRLIMFICFDYVCLFLVLLFFFARNFKNEPNTVESSVELDIVARVTSKDIL